MKFHWSVLFGGVIIAVIAGLVVDWIERRTVNQTVGESSWNLSLTRSNFKNLNNCGGCVATEPAAATTTYRRFTRIGGATIDTQAAQ